ncbi:Ig-like domain-containing protein, partial [bacterium]|nr:Ig-like domain-containing protein [bacterium]
MKIKRLLTILVLTTYYLLLTTYSVGAQPPEIISISPSKGAQEVKTDTLIRITFSKEMDKKSVEDN